MFVDACALVAVLSGEREARRVADAIAGAAEPLTSPVAVLEAALALAREDKLNLPVARAGALVVEFLETTGIAIRDLPPATEMTLLVLLVADRYGTGRRRLNLGDCLHYACARHYEVPILETDDEFRQTDLETLP